MGNYLGFETVVLLRDFTSLWRKLRAIKKLPKKRTINSLGSFYYDQL